MTNTELAKELREMAKSAPQSFEAAIRAAADIVEAHENLKKAFDRESLCHAGCGVIANANTETSLAEVTKGIHPDYLSASLQDCIRAVKREIELRSERDTLQAKVEELEASLPLSTNRTKDQAIEMLGEVLRHRQGLGSHGCVEVTNAISVIDLLIGQRNSLAAENENLRRKNLENSRLASELSVERDEAIIKYSGQANKFERQRNVEIARTEELRAEIARLWVSVDVQLPERGQKVWYVQRGQIRHGEFASWGKDPYFTPGRLWHPGNGITHWMPFYTPPLPNAVVTESSPKKDSQ